jgi:hypothetical protein
MSIRKNQSYRIIPDRFDAHDCHPLLTALKHFLARTVTADLGRRRINPQKLAGQFEAMTVGKRNFKDARLLVKRDYGGMRRKADRAVHGEGLDTGWP